MLEAKHIIEQCKERLNGRSLLTLKDYRPDEILFLLDLAMARKTAKAHGHQTGAMAGKSIVLLFEKASTRTRCAFEVAAFDEGGAVTTLNSSHFGLKESVEDTAKVLGRLYDGIAFRGYHQETVELLSQHSGIPVWNALTDLHHPTQALADVMTILNHTTKKLRDVKVAFVGDARSNVAYSLAMVACKLGMHFMGVGPKSLWPDEEAMRTLAMEAKPTKATLDWSDDPVAGIKSADFVYTDAWVSMGEDDELAQRVRLLRDYQVNEDMMKSTGKKQSKFLHCLPACHDIKTKIGHDVAQKYGLMAMEVTDEVFRSEASVVFEQAENRMHTIKALMLATLGVLD